MNDLSDMIVIFGIGALFGFGAGFWLRADISRRRRIKWRERNRLIGEQ